MGDKVLKMSVIPSTPSVASKKFRRGEVVALNSGGQGMTVREFEGDIVHVDWQMEDGTPVTADYFYDMLSSLEEHEQPGA